MKSKYFVTLPQSSHSQNLPQLLLCLLSVKSILGDSEVIISPLYLHITSWKFSLCYQVPGTLVTIQKYFEIKKISNLTLTAQIRSRKVNLELFGLVPTENFAKFPPKNQIIIFRVSAEVTSKSGNPQAERKRLLAMHGLLICGKMWREASSSILTTGIEVNIYMCQKNDILYFKV